MNRESKGDGVGSDSLPLFRARFPGRGPPGPCLPSLILDRRFLKNPLTDSGCLCRIRFDVEVFVAASERRSAFGSSEKTVCSTVAAL